MHPIILFVLFSVVSASSSSSTVSTTTIAAGRTRALLETNEFLDRVMITLRRVQKGVARADEVQVQADISDQTEEAKKLNKEYKKVSVPLPSVVVVAPDAEEVKEAEEEEVHEETIKPTSSKRSLEASEEAKSVGSEPLKSVRVDLNSKPMSSSSSGSSDTVDLTGLDATVNPKVTPSPSPFSSSSSSSTSAPTKTIVIPNLSSSILLDRLKNANVKVIGMSSIESKPSTTTTTTTSTLSASVTSVESFVPHLSNAKFFLLNLPNLIKTDPESVRKPLSNGQTLFELVLRHRCANQSDTGSLSNVRLLLGNKCFNKELSDGKKALLLAVESQDSTLLKHLLKYEAFAAEVDEDLVGASMENVSINEMLTEVFLKLNPNL